ncbi:hypothetical protein ABT160_27700 [Streptomyces sp. NPDC001941]|uniref:hypothetical protein n=1 Tax=Streptomyces sp. NPDC001941 TaxID=3154659 RepID=UPI003329D5ED
MKAADRPRGTALASRRTRQSCAPSSRYSSPVRAPGPYRTARGEYALAPVKLPGYPAAVEMRATVVGPVGAPGRRPVALFLHGRHYTCYDAAGEVSLVWPCAPGSRPVPSHQGYLRAQQLLASQGYVTLSVSANGVNGQDAAVEDAGAEARSALVRRHLARWADWAAKPAGAPAAVRAVSRADLSRVLLVGHSRGGEGVNRAALDSLTPPPAAEDGAPGPARWTVRGTVLIGPTLFGQNPVPDVPSLTLLPGCDGDVSDLQGELYLDATRAVGRGTALHSAAYVIGANHNFFNSEWTPGQSQAPSFDDFSGEDDPVCSPGTGTRLTAARQQRAGASYIAAAARLFVGGDDRVRPLLDGTGRRAPSAGDARVLTHAVGGHRTPAVLPDAPLEVTGPARICSQVAFDDPADCMADGPGWSARSPHFAYWEVSPEEGRRAVVLDGASSGAPVALTPGRPFPLGDSSSLALRLIVPPGSRDTAVEVRIVDASGRRASLGTARVEGLPGSDGTAAHWAREVRLPLAAARSAGLDLARVRTLELVARAGAGKTWLIDAWGWRPGTPAARPAALARVDVGRLKVREGDSGERTYRVPVHVSGQGGGQVRLFVSDPVTGTVGSRLATVRPGRQDVEVPVTVRGNTAFGWDRSYGVLAKAVRGTSVGAHRGGVLALNDDPLPEMTLAPVADRVAEGGKLAWRVSLSAPAEVGLTYTARFLPPADGGPELSTADVDPGWLDEVLGVPAEPAVPLSRVDGGMEWFFDVPAGSTSTEIAIPTRADTAAEPEESVRLLVEYYDADWSPHEVGQVTGRVTDPA